MRGLNFLLFMFFLTGCIAPNPNFEFPLKDNLTLNKKDNSEKKVILDNSASSVQQPSNISQVDSDSDGVPDNIDAFPLDPAESIDTDNDGIGNNADLDDDGDGTIDSLDTFPLNPAEISDFDGDEIGDNTDTDDDNDNVVDFIDAFPFNPLESKDTDGDGIGDNADTDDDNDGTPDSEDDLPFDPTENKDTDNDGIGDNADTDDDGDGVPDSTDKFPLNPQESLDTDNDGIGNNADLDDDNDGVPDSSDDLPLDPSDSVDTDGDGIGNNTDLDDDGDGVADVNDAFPLDSSESKDFDGDGLGDNQDIDDDNDGVADNLDAFPNNASETVDTDGDGIGNNADTDDDGDGYLDNADAFPLDPTEWLDSDGDGIGDNSETDNDNDGVSNAQDAFPDDPSETIDSDQDGLGNNADLDDDNDGVQDSADAFPLDPNEQYDTDNDGTGNNTDTDDDGDGVADTEDVFPLDASETLDTDNDGVGNNADTDDDNDGYADISDVFPLDPTEWADSDGDGIGDNADNQQEASLQSAIDAWDNDGDGIGDFTDPDDDNDGVNDNDDYRPLDNSISVKPTFTYRLNSYNQTYIREDNPGNNYSSKGFVHLRSFSGNFPTLGILYFDIPTAIDGRNIDSILSSTLTVSSEEEGDSIRIFGTTKTVPEANAATWNNVVPFIEFGADWSRAPVPEPIMGTGDLTPGESSVITLTEAIKPGKLTLFIDELGDSGREKIIKSNAQTFIDFEFTEKESMPITITHVAGTFSSEDGDALQYRVMLTSAPSSEVHIPLGLQDASLGFIFGEEILTFTPQNYNIPQTVTVVGKSDSLLGGNKVNKLLIHPMHSLDVNFNGLNPDDIEFENHSIKINTVPLSLPAADSGSAYSYQFSGVDFEGGKLSFDIIKPPIGMSINENTGVLTWQPDSSEVGTYDIQVMASSETGGKFITSTSIQVNLSQSNPTSNVLYVVPNYLIRDSNCGTKLSPCSSTASALAKAQPGDTVYIRGGRYFQNTDINGVNGANGNQITITRLPGERVKIGFTTDAFYVASDSSYLVFDGLELDGNATQNHWDVIAKLWWDPNGVPEGGAQGFNIDGQYITIRNNFIHDAYQKAVNIYEGRYVNVHGNVIHNIGHTSLSGGHGIMRKWDRDFNDLDVYNSDYPYRWDFYGNLLLSVEQRIYSRVFIKAYANLTIDEGKAILIDQTDNTDPKNRIAHNILLYNGVDHIRLKKNPNTDVHNNSVHADLNRTDANPDGITDKNLLENLKFYGNLVASKGIAFDLVDSFTDSNGNEIIDPVRKYDNFFAGGGVSLGGLSNGITDLGNSVSNLFRDVANNDFTAGPSVPLTAGVGATEQEHLMDLAADYGLEIKSSGWEHDHLRNGETIIENAPSSWIDRTTYYIGDSTVEPGHKKALYLKIVDSDGQWIHDKVEANGWSSLTNTWLAETFQNAEVAKCSSCSGAYVFQILLPHEWFDQYDNGGTFNFTNADGSTTTVIPIDLTIPEHQIIMDYTSQGKVQFNVN